MNAQTESHLASEADAIMAEAAMSYAVAQKVAAHFCGITDLIYFACRAQSRAQSEIVEQAIGGFVLARIRRAAELQAHDDAGVACLSNGREAGL